MATKIGIYITGLGQSFDNETVEKYTERLKNELSFTTTEFKYFLKTEKVAYLPDKYSTVVQLLKKDKTGQEELIYKIYDFQYHNILTDKFNHYDIFRKSLILFGLVMKKTPQLILRMFNWNGFSRPYQTFYAFFILFIISLFILFLIPACIDLILNNDFTKNNFNSPENKQLKGMLNTIDFEKIKKYTISITTLILLFAPQSKPIITALASEFACVDGYINNGEQSQILLGNLDFLIEYIAENEMEPELHFHCYSYGCIVGMDALFPIAEIPPSNNIQNLTKLLITTGNPFEFINAYYPNFYNRRSPIMADKIKWLNIYSILDTFATNFRKDTTRGEAQFGIKDLSILPENINYEIASDKKINLFDFLFLNSIKMHKCYWDSSIIGQSCMKVLLPGMREKKLI